MTLEAKKAKLYLDNKIAKGLRIEVKSKIKNADKALETLKRHDRISEFDPKQSIPVIMQILLEVTNKLPPVPAASSDANNNNLPADELAPTRALLVDALEVFAETDENQNTNMLVLGAKFALTDKFSKENITKGLKKLVQGAQNILITPETELLWEECSIWLQGLHRRTYDKMPLDKNSNPQRYEDDSGYVISYKSKTDHSAQDGDDAKFKKLVGLTKMDISQYYHEASEVINRKLAEFRSGLSAEKIAQAAIRDSSKHIGEAILESRQSIDAKDVKAADAKPVTVVAPVYIASPVSAVAMTVGEKFVTEVDNNIRLGFDLLNATPETVKRLREDKGLEERLRTAILSVLSNKNGSDLSSSRQIIETLRVVAPESVVVPEPLQHAAVNSVASMPVLPLQLPAQVAEPESEKIDLTTLLNKFVNDTETVKMKMLRFGLITIDLSDAQNELLMSLRDDAVTQLEVYINRKNWIDYIKKPANYAEAVAARDDIRAADKPKDILIILLDLRNKLEPLHSTDLKPIVAKVLNDNYTLLSKMEFVGQNKMSMATIAVDNRTMPSLFMKK